MGRGSTATLGGGVMPKIHAVEPWDGKDGQVRRFKDHCGDPFDESFHKRSAFCSPSSSPWRRTTTWATSTSTKTLKRTSYESEWDPIRLGLVWSAHPAPPLLWTNGRPGYWKPQMTERSSQWTLLLFKSEYFYTAEGGGGAFKCPMIHLGLRFITWAVKVELKMTKMYIFSFQSSQCEVKWISVSVQDGGAVGRLV